MASFKHNGQTVQLNYTYFEAMNTFPGLGLDILGVITDTTPILQIMADDKTMIKVWWYFIKEFESLAEEDFDDALKALKPEEMQAFKEAFWESVVNFSSLPMRETLRQMWEQVKKQLKQPKNLLKNISQDSPEEQE